MIGGLLCQGLTAGLMLEAAFIQVTLAFPATSPSASEGLHVTGSNPTMST